MAQVQCFGCNRKFTPRGFSQHVSKSPDPHCRARPVTGEVQLATASIHRTAFSPALDPNQASQGSGIASPDDLDMHDRSLGRHDNEMDARDGMQSPGSGRVSPNDLGTYDDETDSHDSMQSSDGKCSETRIATLNSSELDAYTDELDAVDPYDDLSGPAEPADITDADAYEDLTERNSRPISTLPNQRTIDDTAERSDVAIEQAIPFDVPNLERPHTVVIDCLPLGNAGAPISSMARESIEDMNAESLWAPFTSQCDWEVAHWAKMRGPTSSAVMDLLAIGEVRIFFNPI